MKGNTCLDLFTKSILVLIVCIATLNAQTNAAFAADGKGKVRHPHIVGGTYKFKDYPGMDEGSDYGMRAFDIPMGPTLNAAYQSNLGLTGSESHLDQAIFSLENRDDSFADLYVQDLDPSKHWQSVQAHIGVFLHGDEDCGENIAVVYTLRNSTVIAEFSDSLTLSDMDCRKADYESSDQRAAPTFCAMLGKCLTKYFSNPANREKLQSSDLNKIRELRLK